MHELSVYALSSAFEARVYQYTLGYMRSPWQLRCPFQNCEHIIDNSWCTLVQVSCTMASGRVLSVSVDLACIYLCMIVGVWYVDLVSVRLCSLDNAWPRCTHYPSHVG